MFRFYRVIVVFILLSVTSFAHEEIKRVDEILQDIAVFKREYKEQITKEKQKNHFLEEKIKMYKKEIISLKNQRKNSKKNVFAQKICKDENRFPHLKLKKQ